MLTLALAVSDDKVRQVTVNMGAPILDPAPRKGDAVEQLAGEVGAGPGRPGNPPRSLAVLRRSNTGDNRHSRIEAQYARIRMSA